MPLMCHVACDRHDGLLAVRRCVEEAVSSFFPHGITFFVMQNVATRGDLQRQRASVETLLARDVDMELFVESVNDG